jgi:rRNA maturation RNase YbeY
MVIRLFHAALLPASARKPALLKSAARRALRLEGADRPGELNIVFLDRKKMRGMNRRFLRHGHDTDVIAFRYPEEGVQEGPDIPFGDVYISAHQARLQARRMGHPVLAEVSVLIVHGVLHLLGWRDDSPRLKAKMFRRQDEVLHGKGKTKGR